METRPIQSTDDGTLGTTAGSGLKKNDEDAAGIQDRDGGASSDSTTLVSNGMLKADSSKAAQARN